MGLRGGEGSDPGADSPLGEGEGRIGLNTSADSASEERPKGGGGRQVGGFYLGSGGGGKNVTPVHRFCRGGRIWTRFVGSRMPSVSACHLSHSTFFQDPHVRLF